MLKLTKTGIGLLTKQYRSVLRKCLLLNLGLFTAMFIGKSFAGYGEYDNVFEYIYDKYTIGNARSNFLDIETSLSTVAKPEFYHGKYFNLEDFAVDIVSGKFSYTKSQTDALLNYYYTFRENERAEVIEFAEELNDDILSFKMKELQFQNPTRLGAFIKCDEACPRLSERFASSSQEQMFKNDASNDAGTSRHCLRQFGDVLVNLLKNMASKYAKMNDFMNVEVCHA